MQILAVSVFGISVLEHVFKPALLIFSDGYSPFWPLHDPVGMSFCSLFRHFGQCVHGGNIFICFKAVAWWFPFLFCEKYFVIFRLSPSPCHSQRYAYGYNSILLHIQSSLFQMEELFFFFLFWLVITPDCFRETFHCSKSTEWHLTQGRSVIPYLWNGNTPSTIPGYS